MRRGGTEGWSSRGKRGRPTWCWNSLRGSVTKANSVRSSERLVQSTACLFDETSI